MRIPPIHQCGVRQVTDSRDSVLLKAATHQPKSQATATSKALQAQPTEEAIPRHRRGQDRSRLQDGSTVLLPVATEAHRCRL